MFCTRFLLSSPDETAAFARRFGAQLRAGDVVLLEGQIGAGKSHFARALIQSRLPQPEDIPSPTFTLVQTYAAADTEIWHADLYRLTDPDEAFELGLSEAFETAICLVEWPDRLADAGPADAVRLRFEADADDPERRHVTATATAARWPKVVERALA